MTRFLKCHGPLPSHCCAEPQDRWSELSGITAKYSNGHCKRGCAASTKLPSSACTAVPFHIADIVSRQHAEPIQSTCFLAVQAKGRKLGGILTVIMVSCKDSLSGKGQCWFEQGNGEPEGAALPHFGHGPQQPPQHRHLLGADAQAKACTPPCSGTLHVILCPLRTQAGSFSCSCRDLYIGSAIAFTRTVVRFAAIDFQALTSSWFHASNSNNCQIQ